MKVLLVDGDKSITKAVSRAGHEVVSASDDSHALSICMQGSSPQMVLFDASKNSASPGMDFCKKISRDSELPFKYVILLVSDEEAVSVSKSQEGPIDLLTKSEASDNLGTRLMAGYQFFESISLLLTSTNDLPQGPLPEEKARQLVKGRLIQHFKLNRIETERQELSKVPDMETEMTEELSRQNRELSAKVPDPTVSRKRLEQFGFRIDKLRAKVSADEMDPLEPEHERTLLLAYQQWTAIIQLEREISPILQQALQGAIDEPLYLLLKKYGIDSGEMFSWAVYGVILKQLENLHTDLRSKDRKKLGSDESPSGLMGVFGRGGGKNTEEGQLRLRLQANADLIRAIERENLFIEKRMTDSFWNVYQEAAALLVKNEVSAEEMLLLRAFLRYGMISQNPWLLSKDVADHLLTNCKKFLKTRDLSMSATHVLYADEYICFSAAGEITASIDQDLELNKQKNHDRWVLDKACRRHIFSHVRSDVLQEMATKIGKRATIWNDKAEKAAKKRNTLDHSSEDYRAKNAKILEEVRNRKIDAARCERIVERITKDIMPENQKQLKDDDEKLEQVGGKFPPEEVARREGEEIHRMSRLCARLKDTFPPFGLRDEYKLGSNKINDRQTILDELAEIEQRDPTVFQQLLIPAAQAENRTYIRFSPYVLITPTYGIMGFSWNPRYASEVGRLAFPGFCMRGEQRKTMLYDIFADFRWDTHKARAGVDVMNSDTICSAFGNVRWAYRKKDQEEREKHSIYTDENDRQNWRRHYNLYMSSAMEAGKKLFLKNIEVYDQVILKYIPLPNGIEPLKRGRN